jgi:hypothetical protein
VKCYNGHNSSELERTLFFLVEVLRAEFAR